MLSKSFAKCDLYFAFPLKRGFDYKLFLLLVFKGEILPSLLLFLKTFSLNKTFKSHLLTFELYKQRICVLNSQCKEWKSVKRCSFFIVENVNLCKGQNDGEITYLMTCWLLHYFLGMLQFSCDLLTFALFSGNALIFLTFHLEPFTP